MKSGAVVICVVIGFLFGVGFYHWVVLRGQFPNFNSYPQFFQVSSTLNLNKAISTQSATKSPHDNKCLESYFPVDEVVKGALLQDDPRLLTFIRQNYLHPPSVPAQPYNLTSNVEDTSMGQTKMVLRALNHARNGFFVEAGALDGELRSNTLMLERQFGWNGLLVEGDPKNYALLLQKYRKAWSTPACLATRDQPHQVLFEQAFNRGRISPRNMKQRMQQAEFRSTPPPGTTLSQCFPIFSLLAALNVTEVDYFSLDVEGAEIDVLSYIPFHRVRIKVLSVEFLHTPGGREALRKMMVSKGYRVFGEVRDPRHNWANDIIFIHNSLVP
ncbi:protein Star [Folsomia candida]|uniref:Protein Star n=1 Tax=Folsomia candida TaxID=158441 RepID=A0A226DXW4_FOLCA|nr:protein Star [Folsomia candida]OXA50069.1 Protein Star [Folsomia candida]